METRLEAWNVLMLILVCSRRNATHDVDDPPFSVVSRKNINTLVNNIEGFFVFLLQIFIFLTKIQQKT